MPIPMIALTSFMGVEGLIKRGQSFEVRDEARAGYLERLYYATKSNGEAAARSTQTVTPQAPPTIGAALTSVKGPENTQTFTPSSNKTEISQISAQEQPEPQGEPNTPGSDLDGMSVENLKAIAKDLKIKGYSSMKKDTLIETIQKHKNGGVTHGD